MPGVTRATREYVLRRAAYRCEYCLMQGWWLETDHIIPRSRWDALGGGPGLDSPANLAAACTSCNARKRDHVDGVDALTDLLVPLYHPRTDDWPDHFTFSTSFDEIIGISPTGRVTVVRLGMNRRIYRIQRRLLRQAMFGGGAPWP